MAQESSLDSNRATPRGFRHRIVPRVLVVLFCLFAVLSLISIWTRNQLIDTAR